MTPKSKPLPKWLLMLRYLPIIIQLIDDVVVEARTPAPIQDPTFATQMRLAAIKDLPREVETFSIQSESDDVNMRN